MTEGQFAAANRALDEQSRVLDVRIAKAQAEGARLERQGERLKLARDVVGTLLILGVALLVLTGQISIEVGLPAILFLLSMA